MEELYKEKRVVIYARVSTEHEAQVYALENQLDWYRQILAAKPEWDLVGTYIDEGITGTSAGKRPKFLKMISDAQKHKFDLILTREVSKFARNTVDTLQYTRKLKSLGVEVFFLTDNIRTFDSDGELRLTIMATLAQDESRKTSVRVRAGQRTSREKGVFYGNGNILGYDKVGRDMVINPEQAKTVRMIFDMYLAGMSSVEIAAALEEKQRPTATGLYRWHPETIMSILHNSFYCGIITYNKYYVSDYLEQKVRINKGDIEQFTVHGRHEPIVTEEEYHTVQRLIASRGFRYREADGSLSGAERGFHGSLWGRLCECSCGGSMRIKRWSYGAKGPVSGYQCRYSLTKECSSKMIPEWKLQLAVNFAFSYLIESPETLDPVTDLILKKSKLIARMPDDNSQVIKEKEAEAERYSEREKDLEEMLAKGMISPGVYEIQHLEVRKRLLLLESELELLRKEEDLPDPEITDEERQRCRSRLEAAAGTAFRYNISADVMREFVERIAIGNSGISVYLCFNTNPYIFFREYYPEHQFSRLKRTLIGTGHLTRENTAQIFHPGPDDPYYRLKGIDVKIYI